MTFNSPNYSNVDFKSREKSFKRGRLTRLQIMSDFLASELGKSIIEKIKAYKKIDQDKDDINIPDKDGKEKNLDHLDNQLNKASDELSSKKDNSKRVDKEPLKIVVKKPNPIRIKVQPANKELESLIYGSTSIDNLSRKSTRSLREMNPELLSDPRGELSLQYAPSLEEMYDSLILRINAYDCLDYYVGSEILEEIDTLFLFFDSAMPKYYASQLLQSFVEVMAGTQCIQHPDEESIIDDPDKLWIFVSVSEEIPNLVGNSKENSADKSDGSRLMAQ